MHELKQKLCHRTLPSFSYWWCNKQLYQLLNPCFCRGYLRLCWIVYTCWLQIWLDTLDRSIAKTFAEFVPGCQSTISVGQQWSDALNMSGLQTTQVIPVSSLLSHLYSKEVHKKPTSDAINQCFFFSRNIGWVTPKTIYFHYAIKCFPDQSIPKKMI